MKLFEIFRNGTQQGTIEAGSIKEAENLVFAQYGKKLNVHAVDLFEYPSRWSKQLLELMNAAPESPTYQELEQLQKECRAIGYTFEFGLDAVPFNLKEIEG